jgi:hypothetical protein
MKAITNMTHSATENTAAIPLSQLLYTHEKLSNLARGPLSGSVVGQIKDTATSVALEIGKAPAQSWEEFHRKLAVLLHDWDDVYEFMDVIRGDIARLALTAPEMAEAAE